MTDNWQPIETAPKDGTKILIFDFTYKGDIAVAEYYQGNWHSSYCIDHFLQFDAPTHWQPLPKPPKED